MQAAGRLRRHDDMQRDVQSGETTKGYLSARPPASLAPHPPKGLLSCRPAPLLARFLHRAAAHPRELVLAVTLVVEPLSPVGYLPQSLASLHIASASAAWPRDIAGGSAASPRVGSPSPRSSAPSPVGYLLSLLVRPSFPKPRRPIRRRRRRTKSPIARQHRYCCNLTKWRGQK
ncbi:hypothetical protein GUJ93_ZPchr0014g46705 [Zizania palustris]|uniref:Uncharacterized protein n=1 Tax=Zizania palustris TaxID=103762 RepID=A0A8J5TA82_ZIZPA|nr:hypothetical protein GUJ93_ZPchr0014g46705 [Zizania palustris]